MNYRSLSLLPLLLTVHTLLAQQVRTSSSSAYIKCLYYDAEQRQVWIGTIGQGLWTLRLDNLEAQQVPNYEQTIITNRMGHSNGHRGACT